MSTVKSKKLQVGTDASASNNFTIYQPATPDGTLRIGVGNADSPTEVGRFTSTGYKPAVAPAFSAYASTTQAVSTGVSSKVQLDAETFDTNSNYDHATNYRFTPTVAGYYQVNFNVTLETVGSGKTVFAGIYKNGSAISRGSAVFSGLTGDQGSHTSSIIYLNGTTDYIEFYVFHNNGSNRNVYGYGITYLTAASAILISQA